MSYIGLGPASSALVASGTANSFSTSPSMGSTFTSVGLVDNGALVLNYISTSTTPYVVAATDYYVSMDASGGAKQVNLPNAPTTNRMFVIKDQKGNAGTNNITVTTVGGIVNIDGATTFVMNTNRQAISLVFNGTSYEIF